MLSFIRKIVPERSPLRLAYHAFRSRAAAAFYSFPAKNLTVIGVTGTSGKSTTCEIIQYLLNKSGKKCGSMSTVSVRIGDEISEPPTQRTTQRPDWTQKTLRRMVNEGCKYVVLEVSSHAIDQSRMAGINIDTAVLTNVYDGEHLDYHGDFQDYLKTKMRLFEETNGSARKPDIPKMFILPKESDHFASFDAIPADKKWYYAKTGQADIRAENISYQDASVSFDLRLPNANLHISSPLIGTHNLENLLTAIAVAISHGIDVNQLPELIKNFPGVPGRLESIDMGQDFRVLVDFTYKPSALRSVLGMLSKTKKTPESKIKVIWGGAGGRTTANHLESARLIETLADEFVLTTDDPGWTNPKLIASQIMQNINAKEGDGTFWHISDRYEAIRYALMTAKKDDVVLVAGRGHEKIQIIGSQQIEFDDREIARNILQSMGYTR